MNWPMPEKPQILDYEKPRKRAKPPFLALTCSALILALAAVALWVSDRGTLHTIGILLAMVCALAWVWLQVISSRAVDRCIEQAEQMLREARAEKKAGDKSKQDGSGQG